MKYFYLLYLAVICIYFSSSSPRVSAADKDFVPDTVWHLNNSQCLFNPVPNTQPFSLWAQQQSMYGAALTAEELCLPGFYCPYMDFGMNGTYPASCAPTPACAIRRVVNGEFCDLQSKWEPVVCPVGYYCPTYNQMIKCPSGHWCGLGSVEPVKCDSLSICANGATKETYIGSLIAMVVVDVGLFIIFKLHIWWQRRQGQKFLSAYAAAKAAAKEATTANGNGNGNGSLDIDAEKESSSAPKDGSDEKDRLEPRNPHSTTVNPKLIDSFMRARGSLDELSLQFENVSVSVRAANSIDDEVDEDVAENAVKSAAGAAADADIDENYVKILSGVSGSMEVGRLTVVMGPAGCGKTTLLSALTGVNRWSEHWRQSGTLKLNGSTTKSLEKLAALVGSVGQEDVLHKELTVRDNVLYSAAVRLPASWTRAEVESHVDLVLDALQLTQIRDTVVGDELTRGISGGQRKRTSIAIELAAAPAMLLLDEATAGLDAHVALELVSALQTLSRAARLTVGMVLQQPRLEIWRSLDQVLLLAAGGRTVFLGPPRLAELYFSKRCGVLMKAFDNPANIIIDAISDKTTGAMLADKWGRGGAAQLADLAASLTSPLALTVPSADSSSSPVPAADEQEKLEIQAQRASMSSEPDAVIIHVVSAAADNSLPAPTTTTTAEIQVRPQSNSVPPNSEQNGSVALNLLHSDETKLAAAEAPKVEKRSATPLPTQAGKLDLKALGEQLEGRSAPWLVQMWEAHKRALASQLAKSDSIIIELFVCLLIGCIMGVSGVGRYQGSLLDPYSPISPTSQDRFVSEGAMYVCMTISLAASVAGVGVFGYDIAIIHREADAGHSMSAFYVGHAAAQIYRQLVMALHFTTCYHLLFNPQIDFGTMYAIVFLLFFNFYAAAQIFSFLFSPINATIISSMVTLLVCMFNGYITDIAYGLKVLFVPWWASEAFFSKQVERLAHVYKVDQLTAVTYGYSRGNESRDLAIMFAIGFGYQIIGLLLCIHVFHHRTAKLKNHIVGTVLKGWKLLM